MLNGDEHYRQAEILLIAAMTPDLPYDKAIVAANAAQTHALLAQIATARELGVIQQAGIDAFAAANSPQTDEGAGALPDPTSLEPGVATSPPAPSSQRFCTLSFGCCLADGHTPGCKP